MENVAVQSKEQEVPVFQSKGVRCPELQKVQDVTDLYIDGIRNGNLESLKKAFHPTSSIFGWNGPDLYMAPIQALFDYVAVMPVPSQTGQPTTFITTAIHITGKAATVEMAMDAYQGSNFVDYFQLLKVEDRWWIVSKTFHSDPQT